MILIEDKRFYVYAYLDPRKNGRFSYGEYIFEAEPFYIGKGYDKRLDFHMKEACVTSKNSLKLNVIRKIKKVSGIDPIVIKVKEFLTEKQSYVLENYLIKTIGRRDLGTGPLTNLTDGGEGESHRIFTEEHKDKMSKSAMGRKLPPNHCFHLGRLGLKHTEETKMKIREAVLARPDSLQNKFVFSGKGKKHSAEHKEKIRRSLLGHKVSEETRKKIGDKNRKSFPEEKQLKFRFGFLGGKHSLETRKKMSEMRKGKLKGIKRTDEFKQKQVEINANDWNIETKGKIIKIRNLKKYCLENNIPYSQFRFNKHFGDLILKKVENYG